MKRVEIVRALSEVEELFAEGELRRSLGTLQVTGMGDSSRMEFVTAAFELARAVEYLSPAARRLVEALKLSQLYSPKFVHEVASVSRKDDDQKKVVLRQVGYAASRIDFVKATSAIFREFLSNEAIKMRAGAEETVASDTDVLTLVIREPKSATIPVERFTSALSAVSSLAGVLDRLRSIEGESDDAEIPSFDGLQVLSVDSGSDKSIDLLGAASLVKELKELLFGVWDRIADVIRKWGRVDPKELGEGLGVLKRVSKAKSQGLLTPEEAEILRRTVLKSLGVIATTGCAPVESFSEPEVGRPQLIGPVRIQIGAGRGEE